MLFLTITLSVNGIVYAQQTPYTSKDEVFNEAITQFENADSELIRYETSRNLYLLYRYENLETAISYLKITLESAIKLDDPVKIIYSHSELGAAYGELGEFEQSFIEYTRAINISDSLGIDSERTHTNYHLGKSYVDIMLPYVAEPLLEAAAEEYETPGPTWDVLYELTKLYFVIGDTVSARNEIEKLERLLANEIDTQGIEYQLDQILLSELYTLIGEYEKADSTLSKFEPIEKHVDLRFSKGIALLVTSRIHFKEANFQNAITDANQALALFQTQKNYRSILSAHKQLAIYYEAVGDINNAFISLTSYQSLFDALINRRYIAIASTFKEQADATILAQRQLGETEELLTQRQYFVFALLFMLFGVLILLFVLNKSTKEKKEAAHRLNELNKEKDHFIGIVSHDLRSPLNSIMVLSSLMKEDSKDLHATEIEEYSNIIQNSSKRMEHLVNNMLDANKIETGNSRLKIKEMNIVECLESVYNSTKILGKNKKIHTEFSIEDDIPKVLGEPNAISRILENLMSNAYKFSPPESEIHISLTNEGNQVQLAVSDRGPGLTELDRSKLFKKFEKLSATPTDNEKTTGLGLYIVKNLVHEMNGTILVESEHGVGTTFKVLFNKA